MVAETATPMAPPVRAVVVFIPEAVPAFSRGTLPRIALWLGELNIAQPKPESAIGRTIRAMEEVVSRDAMKNWPTTMQAEPAVHRRRDPKRSDNQPAIGAMITITTELAIMIQPISVGEKPRIVCK